jgi:hypothetical protein
VILGFVADDRSHVDTIFLPHDHARGNRHPLEEDRSVSDSAGSPEDAIRTDRDLCSKFDIGIQNRGGMNPDVTHGEPFRI